jgi:integration host factor subunit beta
VNDESAVTRRDLIKQLAERYPQYPLDTAARAVQEVLASMVEALAREDRIELRGFGSFAVKERPARERHNPRTGATVTLPAAKQPFFKVAKELRSRVNELHTALQQEAVAKQRA